MATATSLPSILDISLNAFDPWTTERSRDLAAEVFAIPQLRQAILSCLRRPHLCDLLTLSRETFPEVVGCLYEHVNLHDISRFDLLKCDPVSPM